MHPGVLRVDWRATSRPAVTGILLSGAVEHGSGYISYSGLTVVDLIAAIVYSP
jgi:hypothetical protein